MYTYIHVLESIPNRPYTYTHNILYVTPINIICVDDDEQ